MEQCDGCHCYNCGANALSVARDAQGDIVCYCSNCGDEHVWSFNSECGSPKCMMLPLGTNSEAPPKTNRRRRRAK